MFERADFERLESVLRGLSGAFIMSINDVPEIRELFSWASIEAVTTTYSIAKNKAGQGKVGELIIRGPETAGR